MIPLGDVHCHLLAGMDDGPRTEADALAMCRMAYADGTRLSAATAHQNEDYAEVTPDGIRAATRRLADRLRAEGVPLRVFPVAEVMARPELETLWHDGEILSVADRGQYLLVEMPRGLFVDLRQIARRLRTAGVRMILAHPEATPELLHEPGEIESLIEAGCLVQVSAKSVTQPRSRRDERALQGWFRRGMVHCLGSDGHSLSRRPPGIAAAYRRVIGWAGQLVADRVASSSASAIFQGLPLQIPEIQRPRRRWFSKLWKMS